MNRKSDLISFIGFGWHKRFYNIDDITDALCKIRYTDFFEYPDDNEFPYDSANSLLRGSCNHFAVALKNTLGYTPYMIETADKRGFHAFCQVYKTEDCTIERCYVSLRQRLSIHILRFSQGARQAAYSAVFFRQRDPYDNAVMECFFKYLRKRN